MKILEWIGIAFAKILKWIGIAFAAMFAISIIGLLLESREDRAAREARSEKRQQEAAAEREAAARQEAEEEQRESACLIARRFITKRLRSPSTAEFQSCYLPDDDSARVTDWDETSYAVLTWVDAQNAFGAQIRSRFLVAVEPPGDDGLWHLKHIEEVK